MKLFRFKTTVAYSYRTPTEFVDWYEGDTLEQAREDYLENLHRYGLPADSKCEVTEMNPQTLKPV